MFKSVWDKETGGVRFINVRTDDTLSVSPRPVFFEELDLLELDRLGWKYPRCKEPLMWACNKQYFYRGQFVFEAKGANLYDKAQVVLQPGCEKMALKPVDMAKMLERCEEELFLIENEAIEFIRDTYQTYSATKLTHGKAKANQLDFEALAAKAEKMQKRKMAIVKEDCDSFDIVPLDVANAEGKKILQTTAKIDVFLASFSGGKDSQVVLDLCTRALPPSAFQVIYSDTGYELPPSLELYEEVKRYYGEKYPELLFRTARNHESVLNYWDKIGTPSDTHRWCCSVMKTAPLYRMLKVDGTNKQARVLAFEGTRGEESNKRSLYDRIGKGVKHNGVINARPIYFWSATEVFLYLFKENLPINKAYRQGKPRVGCVICPFSSEWDDMVVNACYPDSLKPFVDKIIDFAKYRKIPNLEDYVKGHKWKLRASGKFMESKRMIAFYNDKNCIRGKAENISLPLETWLPVLGECVIKKEGNIVHGELKYKNVVYDFEFKYNNEQNCEFVFSNLADVVYAGLVKRALYKSTYCVKCEACEVECPTGALSVLPQININNKCIHCLKCLTFHNKGCIIADSISMAQTDGLKLTGISGYGTFGMREGWLNEYFLYQDDFWSDNSLGNKQEDSFRNWLFDSGIIDSPAKQKGKVVGKLTPLGEFLASIKDDQPDLLWEVIWINLNYKSNLINWFCKNVNPGHTYSKAYLKSLYEQQYEEGVTTFVYSLDALFNLFASTPIGYDFKQKEEANKQDYLRGCYPRLSDYGLVYSLYMLANKLNRTTIRVSDFYDGSLNGGVYNEFGIEKTDLEKLLRSLDSYTNRIVKAELNMGLDHITLMSDLAPLEALKKTLNY